MSTSGLPKRLASAGGVLVVALLLAACGESSDREALEAMIRAAAADTGPATCLRYETLHFLEDKYRREGDAAVRACEQPDPLGEEPRSVDVSQIDITDDSATAVVRFEGSLVDGQKVQYGFVKREGKWKFDEIVGFVDLDAPHLILELGRKGLLGAESPREAENIACWIGRLERMSDKALEELLLGERDLSGECTAESNAI